MITDDPKYDLRWTEESDGSSLKEWLTMPGMSRWFPFTSEKELDPFLKNWIGFHRFRCSLTAVYDDAPIALGTLFLMPYRKVAHHCLLYFIVAPEYARQGVGHSLVKNLCHLGKSRFRLEYMQAELYQGCEALPLLAKLGFYEVFRQEKFVKDNGEYLARHMVEVKL